jgi:hypothetical protein
MAVTGEGAGDVSEEDVAAAVATVLAAREGGS